MHDLKAFSLLLISLILVSQLDGQTLTSSGWKANLDLPVSVLSANEDEEDAPELTVFYGQQYESDAFFFVLDRTISGQFLDYTALPIVKREITRVIREFSPEVEFGVVTFGRWAEVFPPSGIPAQASSEAKANAIAWISRIKEGRNGTCLKKGFFAAIDMAARSSKRRRMIIYVGDGDTHCTNGPSDRYRDEALIEVTRRNRGQNEIHAIGVDTVVDSEGNMASQALFLKWLTLANRGTFRRVGTVRR